MKNLTPHTAQVLKHRALEDGYYSLQIGPLPVAKSCRPGQFVHLRLPKCQVYFRRAMSIASFDKDDQSIEIIFKIFGKGTKTLSMFRKGDEIDVLGPLGNVFAKPRKSETVLLVGGGVGFPPLMFFAERLVAKGADPGRIHFFYGGRSKGDILERKRLKKLGLHLHVATEDGSLGQQGLVTEPLRAFIEANEKLKPRIYACGPEPMLKAVDGLGVALGVPGQLSLEAPMPCGIGVCLGCVVPLRAGGHARVCHDGPVFEIGEVLL